MVGHDTTNESENQMTPPTTNSWPVRLAYLAAAVVAFAVTALVVAAAHSSAHSYKVDGVSPPVYLRMSPMSSESTYTRSPPLNSTTRRSRVMPNISFVSMPK